MANIKLKLASGNTIDLTGLNFGNLPNADDYTETSTLFVADYGFASETFKGKGFDYDKDGVPTGGTVGEYVRKTGVLHLSVTDLHLSVKAIADVAFTSTLSDDKDLIAKALGGADTFVGGNSNDTFNTFAGKDTLDGGRGDDVLHGGSGKDKLTGGKGSDTFVFDTKLGKSNVDAITDFSIKKDMISIDRRFFGEAGDAGALSKGAFWASNSGKAHDESDRFLYDKTDGHLYYDADGNKEGKAVQFADLDAHLKLTAGHFEIF